MEPTAIKDIKDKVRPFLPDGYVKEIQRRLLAKNVRKSTGTISKVCNPEKPNYDIDILAEAVALAADEKKKIENIAAHAEQL